MMDHLRRYPQAIIDNDFLHPDGDGFPDAKWERAGLMKIGCCTHELRLWGAIRYRAIAMVNAWNGWVGGHLKIHPVRPPPMTSASFDAVRCWKKTQGCSNLCWPKHQIGAWGVRASMRHQRTWRLLSARRIKSAAQTHSGFLVSSLGN